jgi:hypothetical protein
MEEVKSEEAKLKENRQTYLRETKRLKLDYTQLSEKVKELKKCEVILGNLHQEGIIDEHGQPLEN